MYPHRLTRLSILPVIVGLLLTVPAGADTFAMFANPAHDEGECLVERAGSALSRGCQGSRLHLITPVADETYDDAAFAATDLTVSAMGATSAGTIQCSGSAGTVIPQVDFDAARGHPPFGSWADSPVCGYNVSVANRIETSTECAASASSATPKPGALMLLAFGSAVLASSCRRA